jgi:hypothetical protein
MKFANSYRLIKRDAVLDDTWHPLNGGPAPEHVPPSWDGPHVGKPLGRGIAHAHADAGASRPAGHRQSLASLCARIGPTCSRNRKRTQSRSSATSARQTVPGCGRAQSRSHTWSRPSVGPLVIYAPSRRWCAQVQAVAVARSRDSDTDGAARKLRFPQTGATDPPQISPIARNEE